MRARVSDAVLARVRPVVGSGVVDRIHIERLCADARAQGGDERASRRADAGRVIGAAGEHHLNVRTRIGRGQGDCRRDDGDANTRRRDYRGTKETTNLMREHAAECPIT
jgi:hypothetical protein